MWKQSQPRRLSTAALGFAMAALGGCLAETGDSTTTALDLVNLSEFITEFLRAALAAWVL